MKTIKTLILGAAVSLMAANAFAVEAPQKFNKLPDAVYVPVGFDNNDNKIEFAFEQQFSNTCYSEGTTNIEVDSFTKEIRVKNTAYFKENEFCLMVMRIYPKFVEIDMSLFGNNVGEYRVKFENDEGSFTDVANINIAAAVSPNQDDYLYAAVNKNSHLVREMGQKTPDLVLTGTYGNTCTQIDRVELSRPSKGVVQVLPILKVKQGVECAVLPAGIPFAHKVSLDDLGHGRVLIHIRAQNGRAVNLIDNI